MDTDADAEADGDARPDPTLRVPDGWTETAFEPGRFGPDDAEGFAAAFEYEDEGGTMEAAVRPGRFRREAGTERFDALGSDVEVSRDDLAVADRPEVEPATAFAATVTSQPGSRTRRATLCFAADVGDALAAVLWVLRASETDWQLNRNVALHSGDPVSGVRGVVPDEDALAATLADAPDRCVFTGRPTRSHTLSVPLRYAPTLADYPTTDRGVPRIPPTIHALRGAVSHAAWEEHDLGTLDTGAPIERADRGVYRLAPAVLETLAGLDASRFTVVSLGE